MHARSLPILTLLLACALPIFAQGEKLQLDLGDRHVEGVRSRTLFAVESRDDETYARLPRRLEIFEARVADALPERRIHVFSVLPDRLDVLVSWLAKEDDVVFARPIVHHGDPALPGSRWIPTQNLVVRFHPELSKRAMQRVVGAHGAEIVRRLDFLPGTVVVRARRGVDPMTVLARLERRGDVLLAHPDWLRKLDVRQHQPNDPLFGNQWHLRNVGQGAGVAGADIKATFAWTITQGAGTTIAIIDTGVESGHVDIVQSQGFNPALGAGPLVADDVGSHGTRVAGVAAATGDNGVMITGVAPAATVMPIRLLGGAGYGTPSEEAACFAFASDNGADVICNAWGPDGVPFPLPTLVAAALQYVTDTGRGGKGCPIFWAAGNANEDLAADGYVSSPLTIAVGASTNFDQRASYGDWGSALDLLAPSSGGTRGINTTTPSSSTTLSFAGTSASAPQAAGAAALMLAANPALTWTDVRDLLRTTAAKIDAVAAGYGASGHSITHGHGRLDAQQAVLAALASDAWSPQLTISSWGLGDLHVAIAGLPPACEWVIAFSGQTSTPLGSGPLFGVGWDGVLTVLMPAGVVPFHAWANAGGSFGWGSTGLPLGLYLEAVAIGIDPVAGLLPSNVSATTIY